MLTNVMTRANVLAIVVMGSLVAGLYVSYRLALPFISPLVLALVLAILFAPLHRWIERKLKAPALAAAISVVIVGLIVIAPVTIVAGQLVEQAAAGALLLKTKLEGGLLQNALAAHPKIPPVFHWVVEQIDLRGIAADLTSWLTNVSTSFLRGSAMQIVAAVLTFYLLFYFLRDEHDVLRTLRGLSPFTDAETTQLFHRVVDTVHATIYGTIAIGTVQGILGGLVFALLGLPAPLLWGLVMGLLAVMPVLGAFVVWIPAAIFLALDGNWGKAALLAAAGAGVSTVDNLLYPMLVGNRLKLHTVLAFISVVGGLMLFGPAGFILGPLAVVITLLILEILRARLQPSEAAPNDGVHRWHRDDRLKLR